MYMRKQSCGGIPLEQEEEQEEQDLESLSVVVSVLLLSSSVVAGVVRVAGVEADMLVGLVQRVLRL